MRKGFTLIEVVVALAILLAAVGSSFLLFRSGMEGAKLGKELTRATYRVQEKMENLRGLPFQTLSSHTFDLGQGAVDVTSLNSDLKKIEVRLDWRGGRPPLQLTTLRSKY